jgi:hypothetical protein
VFEGAPFRVDRLDDGGCTESEPRKGSGTHYEASESGGLQ